MPIGLELHYLYAIDRPQVSRWVRFVRAEGTLRGLREAT